VQTIDDDSEIIRLSMMGYNENKIFESFFNPLKPIKKFSNKFDGLNKLFL